MYRTAKSGLDEKLSISSSGYGRVRKGLLAREGLPDLRRFRKHRKPEDNRNTLRKALYIEGPTNHNFVDFVEN